MATTVPEYPAATVHPDLLFVPLVPWTLPPRLVGQSTSARARTHEVAQTGGSCIGAGWGVGEGERLSNDTQNRH